MRILLINSPYQFPDPTTHRTELLGLEYLGSSLRKSGHEVFIYDPTTNKPTQLPNSLYYYGTTNEDIYNKIKSFQPDCVGISCHYSYSSKEAYKVAEIVKNIDSNIIVVMGGLFISVFHERALTECDAIDYGLIGESEISFPTLLLNISLKTKKLNEVDGLIYKDKNEILKNKKSKYIDDLDSLPFPARDMVDIAFYMHANETKRLYGLGTRPALSLLTSRSCPYRCSFCNMKLVHGPYWRRRTPENVINEIDEIVNKYKAKHVFIMDDNFSLEPDRVKSICRGIIKKGYKFRWNTPNGISVKRVDEEMAHLMKRAGCANVCIAIESGSDYIREEVMNKKISKDEIKNAVECFKRANIPVVGFVLLGMPGETEKYFKQTFKFVTSLPLVSIVVSFAIPFPGTKLHEDLIKQGIIDKNYSVDMDDLNTPAYSTNSFTKNELIKRKKILKDSFPSLAILSELEAKNEQYF